MDNKRSISRRQFISGGATMFLATMFSKLSGQSFADQPAYSDENNRPSTRIETAYIGWEELPLDILSGAGLIVDTKSELFGVAFENEGCVLTQYIHAYPGLELMLSDTVTNAKENGWIGYNKAFVPVVLIHGSGGKTEKKIAVSIPEDVYYLRGSCSNRDGNPRVWVKNTALYALQCSLNKPDVSSYMEITELSFDQRSRKDDDGDYDQDAQDCPSLGDLFFSPIGTEIILTFKNANIAPYIHSGASFRSMVPRKIFSQHYGFGFSWYYCKTEDICNFLGAYYATINGCIKALTVDELRAADPHLYIRFPSKVLNTLAAARIRRFSVTNNSKRLFTVVHITDIHGDMDSAHAAYEYADQIGADIVALTGDHAVYRPYHGYNILHSLIKKAKTPTVYSIGNHDVNGISDREAYQINIAPIKSVIKASETHSYYYRDFEYSGETVRVISLYPFFEKAIKQNMGYYTQEQLMWLCNVLSSTPDGGHIFILRHFSHHKPILLNGGDSMFYDFGNSNSEEGLNLWLCMDEDPIKDIVDSFNERKVHFSNYTGELKDGPKTITVKYDFTKRTDSEFVAYFSGHMHIDHVGYTRNTRTKQAILGSLCTTGVTETDDYTSFASLSSPRDYGTDSQIALNVFSFDFEKKKIYIARVGNGQFNDRMKTFLELSY